jgi:hypothetical protein
MLSPVVARFPSLSPRALMFRVSVEQDREAFPGDMVLTFFEKFHCGSPYVIRMCVPSGWHFNLALHCQMIVIKIIESVLLKNLHV